MSGPIVRRYGFPNFDKIFGERPLQHGIEEAKESEPETQPAKAKSTKPKGKSTGKTKAPRTKKP